MAWDAPSAGGHIKALSRGKCVDVPRTAICTVAAAPPQSASSDEAMICRCLRRGGRESVPGGPMLSPNGQIVPPAAGVVS